MDEQHRLTQQRLEKLEQLEERGVAPFPYGFTRSHRIAEILERGEAMAREKTVVRVAGRMMSKRRHGKTAFAHLEDQDGRLQIYVRRDAVGEEAYEAFKLLDVGDVVGVEGAMMLTRTGELTVEVQKIELLTKSLRPLPEKWHGLTDKEIRYRQRYLDLVMNPEVRASFVRRSQVIQTIREVLVEEGFLEVCLLYTSPSPRDRTRSRMPSSA